MIRHTVAFALRHEPGSPAEAAFIEDGRRALTSIPGVLDFTVSRQVSPKSDYRFQFAMTFADASAYEGYNAHPAHVAFVEQRWVSEVREFEELDFEPY
ncbi:Dabb family protein [Agromyces aerolatus]|uniref:Dabb family protein n=1 Tax=Agromyces sp. LY-1074 TaxID=3074080 RepID=UPI00285DD326|nr:MULTISPECIES: Dabb family protein [unclassified Agromyces]MDR5698957.1 Dabb family protein [Agromyces sp. LY-1074]MDR5705265.1 Dabb family protein [Agromyces sp. LY-1358]